MPKPKPDVNIPLHCSLCPKKPQFSDVSHLLTHISSKSHLSHKFKLQIRAGTEKEATDRLEEFNAWYTINSLDTLLSDRLAAKEGKKMVKAKRRPVDSTHNKKEFKLEIDPAMTASHTFKAPVPRMHTWATGVHIASASSPSPSDWDLTPHRAAYATPSTRRNVPNFANDETDEEEGVEKVPNKMKLTKPDITDCLKLKGVQWPGMDIFDAATPEMKRVRNQRKNTSVLAQMIATSAEIKPAELVFTADGEFRNSRDIFGPPSCENSPSAPRSPKKRRTTTRKASLADVSVNAPRLRAPRAKTIPSRSPEKRDKPVRTTYHPSARNSLETFGYGDKYRQQVYEEELRMTAGDDSKKSSFQIFQDVPEVSPGRTESPLEEPEYCSPSRSESFADLCRFEYPTHGLSLYTAQSSSHFISPAPMSKLSSSRPFEKENKKPGRLSSPSSDHGHYHQQSPSQLNSPRTFVKPEPLRALEKERSESELAYQDPYERRVSMYNLSVSEKTKERLWNEVMLNRPPVPGSAYHTYPPHVFSYDSGFNPLFSPYLRNNLQDNAFNGNGFARSSVGEMLQPSYNEEAKPRIGSYSTFQGSFKEFEQGNRESYLIIGDGDGFGAAAATSPAHGESPESGVYMGI